MLVLLLLLYTISSFVSSHRYIKRGKEYSTALFLSQTKMEALQVTPLTDIALGEGQCEAPFQEYHYRVELSPWEGDLQQLEVRVTSPRGAQAKVLALRQLQSFQGVATDPATNTVVFSKPHSAQLHSWNDVVSSVSALSGALPGGDAGALAGAPGWNLLWAANISQNTLVPYRESEQGKWGTPIAFPPVEGLGPTRLAGISMDQMGNMVFAADSGNRGLWLYTDGLPGLAKGFLGKRPHAPQSPPLGIPSGVSSDATGSLVVVADTENQCLRKLFVNLASPTTPPSGYSSEQLEAAPGIGFWLKDRLRHPTGMGAPQGIVLNSSGWSIYCIDRAYLYEMIEEIPGEYQWKRVPLKKELTQSAPSGLAYDEFNNLLFIATKTGELWKHRLGSGQFQRVAP